MLAMRYDDDVEDRSVSTTVRQAPTGGAERPLLDDTSWPDESRRRRKKRQTRDALIDTALDLFETKGYEHTAVHEITDAIDVAERTFFRYFASKEDLALFFVETRNGRLHRRARRATGGRSAAHDRAQRLPPDPRTAPRRRPLTEW